MPRDREFIVPNDFFSNAIDVSPDGRFLATADTDKTIYVYKVNSAHTNTVWRPAACGLAAILSRHDGAVLSVRFSPDGKTLASAGKDGQVYLWPLSSIAGSPIKNVIRPGATDAEVKAADVRAETRARLLGISVGARAIAIRSHCDAAVQSVRWSPDGQKILTASDDGTARLFPATPQAFVRRAHEILALRSWSQERDAQPLREKSRKGK